MNDNALLPMTWSEHATLSGVFIKRATKNYVLTTNAPLKVTQFSAIKPNRASPLFACLGERKGKFWKNRREVQKEGKKEV
jgi:hypothetical protein